MEGTKLKTTTGKLNGGKQPIFPCLKKKVEETRPKKGISNAFFVSLLLQRDINSVQVSIARSSRQILQNSQESACV